MPFWCCVSTAIVVVIIARQQNRISQLRKLQDVRQRIASDLHDDIGSTLTSISILSKSSTSGDTDEHKKSLSTIADASIQASSLLGDIVWSVNPENDRIQNVVSRMREYVSSTLEPAGIEFEIVAPEESDRLQLPMDKRKDVYLIFKEAVTNSVKYSRATHIRIIVACTQQYFSLQVIDNGSGFSVNGNSTGNGLKSMRNRAESLRGIFNINSGAGNGTTISLDVPLGSGKISKPS